MFHPPHFTPMSFLEFVRCPHPSLPLPAAWSRRERFPGGDGRRHQPEEAERWSSWRERAPGRTRNWWEGQKEARAPTGWEASSESTRTHQNPEHTGGYGYQLQGRVRLLSHLSSIYPVIDVEMQHNYVIIWKRHHVRNIMVYFSVLILYTSALE